MAAIAYFEKILEDTDHVTYRYGPNEDNLEHSFLINKTDLRPTDDPEKSTLYARLAFRGIIRGYRKLGHWPDRGAGYT
jgi:hypothetical protein